MTSSAILSLANPVLAIFFAITFYCVWQRQPKRLYILNWALVFVFAALGFAIESQRSTLDEQAISIAINLCHGLVALCTARGIALRYWGVPKDRVFVSLFAVSSSVMIWFTLSEPNIIIRGLSTSIGMSLMLVIAGIAAIRGKHRDPVDVAICAALVIVALLIFLRPLLATQLAPFAVDGDGNKEILYIYSAMLLALFAWVGFAILFLVRIATDLMSELETLAVTDAMTSLLNRRGFFERSQSLLDLRTPAQSSTLLLIDIDRFKRVNDGHGHPVGDAVIRFVSNQLKTMAPTSILARLGGEEFVLLFHATNTATVETLAEKMRSKIQSSAIDGAPSGLRVTISAGISKIDNWTSIDEALIDADKALYKAKRDGRNQVVIFDPSRDSLIDFPHIVVAAVPA